MNNKLVNKNNKQIIWSLKIKYNNDNWKNQLMKLMKQNKNRQPDCKKWNIKGNNLFKIQLPQIFMNK